jgi:D-alanyl-D-alanine carboxypeptidase
VAAGGPIQLATVGGITVAASLAPHLALLLEASRAAGLALGGGGYRSAAQQIQTRINNGCPDIYNSPASACSPPTARPGQSMHEQGLAIDFTCSGSLISSRSSPCFQWLAANAARYGLYNLPSEPWHWSTNGN